MKSYEKYPKALNTSDYVICGVFVVLLLGLALWWFLT